MELIIEGWIKLHRKLLKWEWIESSKHLGLFIHILLRANYETTRWRGRVIKPGQLLTGRKQLSKWSGLTEQSVRTVLKDLKSTNEITIKSTSKYSIITLTRWSDYQLHSEQPTTKSTSKLTINQPAINQQSTTSKKVKKEKKREKESPPPNFLIKNDLNDLAKGIDNARLDSFIKDYGEDVCKTQLESLGNYMRSQGKNYKCYISTIRNWCRRDNIPKITNQYLHNIEKAKDRQRKIDAKN